jgi:NAD(P)-dependent dehydrogenase (short-subunit alcohol dehydrogenase family)
MVKSVLITGANAGLGKDCARQLAAHPETERIILGCRNPAKAEAAKAELEQATGRTIFEILLIDVMDLASVRKAAAQITEPIEGLVMNAGGMGGSTPSELTTEGASHIFAVNVLGHAVLLEELLQAKKLTKVAVYAGSEAARGVKRMMMSRPDLGDSTVADFTSVIDGSRFGTNTDPMVSYGPVKMVAAMWMSAMARKHPGIRLVTMSPGGTSGTSAADAMAGPMGLMMKYVMMPMMTIFGQMHALETGAKRYVDALQDDQYKSGGFYASEDGRMTGPIVEQATVFADLGNPAFQDNANEAVHRFFQ